MPDLCLALGDCQTFLDLAAPPLYIYQHCRLPISLHSCSVQLLSPCPTLWPHWVYTDSSIRSFQAFLLGCHFVPQDLPGEGSDPWSLHLTDTISVSHLKGLLSDIVCVFSWSLNCLLIHLIVSKLSLMSLQFIFHEVLVFLVLSLNATCFSYIAYLCIFL